MSENGKKQSVYVLVNQARGMLVDAVGQVMANTGLPPYIIDGILSGILSDIRQKEIYDLGILMAREDEPEKENTKEEDDGGHQSGT